MARRIATLLSLVLVLSPSIAEAETEHRNVLLLNSYHSGYRWTDAVTSAVNDVIGNRSDIHLFVEYMDTKRWSDDAHFQHYLRLLRYKYQEAGGTGLPLAEQTKLGPYNDGKAGATPTLDRQTFYHLRNRFEVTAVLSARAIRRSPRAGDPDPGAS